MKEMNDLQIRFVDAQSFINNLNSLFLNCNKLDIAMAYVKTGGLKTLLTELEGSHFIKEGLPIRIVFGLCSRYGITDKDAARKLLELAQKHENIQVKKLNCPSFHPKLMVFHGNPNRVLLGSSNLTVAAQTKNIEANVIVESPDSEFFRAVTNFFEDCFKDAIFLNKTHVDEYSQHQHKSSKYNQKYPKEDKTPSFPMAFSPSKEQKWDVLLAVTHGAEKLEIMKEVGYGKWTIGKSMSLLDSIKGREAYFYINQNKMCNLVGTIKSTKIKDEETIFLIDNIKSIKNRKLDSFKKRDGKKVQFVGCFVYLSK